MVLFLNSVSLVFWWNRNYRILFQKVLGDAFWSIKMNTGLFLLVVIGANIVVGLICMTIDIIKGCR